MYNIGWCSFNDFCECQVTDSNPFKCTPKLWQNLNINIATAKTKSRLHGCHAGSPPKYRNVVKWTLISDYFVYPDTSWNNVEASQTNCLYPPSVLSFNISTLCFHLSSFMPHFFLPLSLSVSHLSPPHALHHVHLCLPTGNSRVLRTAHSMRVHVCVYMYKLEHTL